MPGAGEGTVLKQTGNRRSQRTGSALRLTAVLMVYLGGVVSSFYYFDCSEERFVIFKLLFKILAHEKGTSDER